MCLAVRKVHDERDEAKEEETLDDPRERSRLGGVLGTLVMAGGDLCAMTRSSTLCGRSTLLGKRGLSALGRAAATLLTQERHAQDMSLEIAADMCGLTRGSCTR